MKSVLLTAIFVLFIPISFFVIYNSFIKEPIRPTTGTPTQLPNDQVSIPVTGNDQVIISDFAKSNAVVADTDNPGLYFYGSSLDSVGSENSFTISYDAGSGYFNIVLLRLPFSQSRLDAERALKEVLQVSESEMCRLSYSVTVPGYVSDAASGIDYRFSFCADSVTI